jgi:hypothetical protein
MGFPTNAPKLKIVEDLERPQFLLTPNNQWRQVEQEWNQASKEKAEDYVYQLVLHFGANAKLIAQRFGLEQKAVEATFGTVIKKAQAELAMLIFRDQITAALETTSTQMKQHVGKHFAGQIENQTISTTDSDDNKVEFEVKLVKVDKTVDDEAN